MKDPFEAAFQEQDSPPDSPEDDATAASAGPVDAEDYDVAASSHAPQRPWSSTAPTASISAAASWKKLQVHKEQEEEDEEEEEDHMEVVVDKLPSSTGNRDERNMNAILSQFTPEQLNRFEAFRRSGFQKSSMRRILASITGNQNMSMQTTIVVSGIAKTLVGELTETARIVMTERKDSGPIRPCHIREAYRRLKLEGKIPRRSVPRLFR